MLRPRDDRRWRLIGTTPKAPSAQALHRLRRRQIRNLQKPLRRHHLRPVIVADFSRDLDQVETIIRKDTACAFSRTFPSAALRPPAPQPQPLLGSVIKLSPFTRIHRGIQRWLNTIPYYVKELVFIVSASTNPVGRRLAQALPRRPHQRRPRLRVEVPQRQARHQYLRVGYTEDGSWRTSPPQGLLPARKIQTEDDITAPSPSRASTSRPQPALPPLSVKFAVNCEYRLFQRPDDAVIRATTRPPSRPLPAGNFISNFEPLTREAVKQMTADTIHFFQFTPPMRKF